MCPQHTRATSDPRIDTVICLRQQIACAMAVRENRAKSSSRARTCGSITAPILPLSLAQTDQAAYQVELALLEGADHAAQVAAVLSPS
jgi:hypothetical protein